MHRLTRLVLSLSLLLMVGGLASSGVYAHDVSVGVARDAEQNPQDFNWIFNPTSVTVNVGDTVTWMKNSEFPHTSTASNRAWDSGNITPGGRYAFTFRNVGTYRFFCAYHEGQVGTVIVKEQAAATDTQQEGTGDTGATPEKMPQAGAGGMAGTAGLPFANLAGIISLLAATGYAILRRR